MQVTKADGTLTEEVRARREQEDRLLEVAAEVGCDIHDAVCSVLQNWTYVVISCCLVVLCCGGGRWGHLLLVGCRTLLVCRGKQQATQAQHKRT